MNKPYLRISLVVTLVLLLVGGGIVVVRANESISRTNITAYFANTNGLFVGDEVRLLGVPVGKIDSIEPQPQRVKVQFWVDRKYPVPADAKAVVLSPSLVTSRAIELTPVYTTGPKMPDNAVIPQDRTAVPVEWDNFRQQMERLTAALQPTSSGGVSTLGAFIDTAADNLRGQGSNIRDAIIRLSQAFSALGDHSDDLFSTIRDLSIVVSALQDSTDVMRALNQNLAGVTGLLTNSRGEVGLAVSDINDVVGDVSSFVADSRDTVGTTSDKLASITTALQQSRDDLEQTLHIAPTEFDNYVNIFEPAQQAITGAFVATNFANPVSFLCGALQAASRLSAEQSAKLCVQYLAPIMKNRQFNFPPIGGNPIVGAQARPNEITYSEDWLRPDYVPPGAPAAAPPPPSTGTAPLPAEAQPTDPAAGLTGLMVPAGGGS
ncbi:Virulence factor Mce family protein [uncultured Mycobacterium sp.]|uniref:Virulence factor Mce family protein n=1 Tax=uncultured Mycobacterium sp. TaxID=171292 RepID=A0A1Y5PK99_9MYCO|nr:Virulence factor Mce family protein [uncultured Mycobacterium sp.]